MEAALLASAAEILETEGPDALSVRRIAAAADVAPMGVYNHFESKFGIVEALFVQGFERLGDAMTTIADIQDPYEALREGGRRYRALALAHPMVYQLMFLRAVPGLRTKRPAARGRRRGVRQPGRRRQRAMAAGVIAEAAPTETAQLIWANIHGWVSLELLGIGFVEDQEAGIRPGVHDAAAGAPPLTAGPLPAGNTIPPARPHAVCPAQRGSGRSRFQCRATDGYHRVSPSRTRDHPEPGDGALPALVVAVEQLDREGQCVPDVPAQAGVVGVVGVPDGGLPEADVARSDVEVPRLQPEVLRIRVRDVVVHQRRRDASIRTARPARIPTLRSEMAR